jgi:hypothetical protein
VKRKGRYTKDEPREERESRWINLASSFIKDSSIRRGGYCARITSLSISRAVEMTGAGASTRPALKEIDDGLIILAFCLAKPGRLTLGLAASSIF